MSKYLTVQEILNVTGGKLLYGNEEEQCKSFSRNTKEINKAIKPAEINFFIDICYSSSTICTLSPFEMLFDVEYTTVKPLYKLSEVTS